MMMKNPEVCPYLEGSRRGHQCFAWIEDLGYKPKALGNIVFVLNALGTNRKLDEIAQST